MLKFAVIALCVIALGLAGAVEAQESPSNSFVVRDVRVFDGEGVSEHRSVVALGASDEVVVEGEIVRVGQRDLAANDLPVIDGRGHTLLPGLIDSHVHLPGANPARALAQSAAFGVTTVIDMFSAGETLAKLRELRSLDDPRYSSLLLAGTGATAPGGHPSQMTPADFPTIGRPEDAQDFVDARIAEGSDFIKLIYDDLRDSGQPLPMLDVATLRALISAAHERNKLAIAHIRTEAQARDAIDAGVDGLAHLFNAERVSAGFGRFAARHGVFVIPTLSVLHVSCGRSDGQRMLEDPRLEPFIAPEWRELAALTLPASQSCAATRPTIRSFSKRAFRS